MSVDIKQQAPFMPITEKTFEVCFNCFRQLPADPLDYAYCKRCMSVVFCSNNCHKMAMESHHDKAACDMEIRVLRETVRMTAHHSVYTNVVEEVNAIFTETHGQGKPIFDPSLKPVITNNLYTEALKVLDVKNSPIDRELLSTPAVIMDIDKNRELLRNVYAIARKATSNNALSLSNTHPGGLTLARKIVRIAVGRLSQGLPPETDAYDLEMIGLSAYINNRHTTAHVNVVYEKIQKLFDEFNRARNNSTAYKQLINKKNRNRPMELIIWNTAIDFVNGILKWFRNQLDKFQALQMDTSDVSNNMIKFCDHLQLVTSMEAEVAIRERELAYKMAEINKKLLDNNNNKQKKNKNNTKKEEEEGKKTKKSVSPLVNQAREMLHALVNNDPHLSDEARQKLLSDEEISFQSIKELQQPTPIGVTTGAVLDRMNQKFKSKAAALAEMGGIERIEEMFVAAKRVFHQQMSQIEEKRKNPSAVFDPIDTSKDDPRNPRPTDIDPDYIERLGVAITVSVYDSEFEKYYDDDDDDDKSKKGQEYSSMEIEEITANLRDDQKKKKDTRKRKKKKKVGQEQENKKESKPRVAAIPDTKWLNEKTREILYLDQLQYGDTGNNEKKKTNTNIFRNNDQHNNIKTANPGTTKRMSNADKIMDDQPRGRCNFSHFGTWLFNGLFGRSQEQRRYPITTTSSPDEIKIPTSNNWFYRSVSTMRYLWLIIGHVSPKSLFYSFYAYAIVHKNTINNELKRVKTPLPNVQKSSGIPNILETKLFQSIDIPAYIQAVLVVTFLDMAESAIGAYSMYQWGVSVPMVPILYAQRLFTTTQEILALPTSFTNTSKVHIGKSTDENIPGDVKFIITPQKQGKKDILVNAAITTNIGGMTYGDLLYNINPGQAYGPMIDLLEDKAFMELNDDIRKLDSPNWDNTNHTTLILNYCKILFDKLKAPSAIFQSMLKTQNVDIVNLVSNVTFDKDNNVEDSQPNTIIFNTLEKGAKDIAKQLQIVRDILGATPHQSLTKTVISDKANELSNGMQLFTNIFTTMPESFKINPISRALYASASLTNTSTRNYILIATAFHNVTAFVRFSSGDPTITITDMFTPYYLVHVYGNYCMYRTLNNIVGVLYWIIQLRIGGQSYKTIFSQSWTEVLGFTDNIYNLIRSTLWIKQWRSNDDGNGENANSELTTITIMETRNSHADGIKTDQDIGTGRIRVVFQQIKGLENVIVGVVAVVYVVLITVLGYEYMKHALATSLHKANAEVTAGAGTIRTFMNTFHTLVPIFSNLSNGVGDNPTGGDFILSWIVYLVKLLGGQYMMPILVLFLFRGVIAYILRSTGSVVVKGVEVVGKLNELITLGYISVTLIFVFVHIITNALSILVGTTEMI